MYYTLTTPNAIKPFESIESDTEPVFVLKINVKTHDQTEK